MHRLGHRRPRIRRRFGSAPCPNRAKRAGRTGWSRSRCFAADRNRCHRDRTGRRTDHRPRPRRPPPTTCGYRTPRWGSPAKVRHRVKQYVLVAPRVGSRQMLPGAQSSDCTGDPADSRSQLCGKTPGPLGTHATASRPHRGLVDVGAFLRAPVTIPGLANRVAGPAIDRRASEHGGSRANRRVRGRRDLAGVGAHLGDIRARPVGDSARTPRGCKRR